MGKFILSIDQGTTSSRAVIFDHDGNAVAVRQKEFTQYFPKPGWVEHDAEEIRDTVMEVVVEALSDPICASCEIDSIGITNQRETTIVWDSRSGKPVCHAIVWQDRRTADFCDYLKGRGLEDTVRQKTGLLIDPYFSGTKIKWILDNISGARELADRGLLRFGTVDSWLVWNMTGGRVHVTDVTNASRTMLFNIHSLKWDKELLDLMEIPCSMLPEVKSCSEVFGEASIAGRKIRISGIAGDQQSALFGQMCTEPGSMKNTYGTGCFLLMNTGETPIESKNRLITTIACKIGAKTTYALEGSVFVAGSIVQWLRDGLGIIKSSSDVGKLAGTVPDNGGVYFVPALTGLGAPYWDPDAKGTITGITRGTKAAHIARAADESMAYQTMDIVTAMENDAGVSLTVLKVDGGATRDDLLMQFQADILGAKVVRPGQTEATALGAAYLAGLATGFWTNLDEIKSQWKIEREFVPEKEISEVESLKAGWRDAISRTLSKQKK